MTKGEKLAYDFFYGDLESDRSAAGLTELIGEACKRTLEEEKPVRECVAQFRNMFFEFLSSDVGKYDDGHHAKGCAAIRDVYHPEPCDCIVRKMLTLMDKIDNGEYAEKRWWQKEAEDGTD